MVGQYRPIHPYDRLPLTGIGRFAGESVRMVPPQILREIASQQLEPVSDRSIPRGIFAGQRIRDLSVGDLDRIAAKAADTEDVLSDDAWIRQQARNELVWRAVSQCKAELTRRGEPLVRTIQPWKG